MKEDKNKLTVESLPVHKCSIDNPRKELEGNIPYDIEISKEDLKKTVDYLYEAYQDAGNKMFDYKDKLEKAETRIKELEEINETHKKENGELREKEADLTTVYLSGVYDGEKKWKDKIKNLITQIESCIDFMKTDKSKKKVNKVIRQIKDLNLEIMHLKGLLEEDK